MRNPGFRADCGVFWIPVEIYPVLGYGAGMTGIKRRGF